MKNEGRSVKISKSDTLANHLYLYILKRIGYKIGPLILCLITIDGMFMISVFYWPHENI